MNVTWFTKLLAEEVPKDKYHGSSTSMSLMPHPLLHQWLIPGEKEACLMHELS